MIFAKIRALGGFRREPEEKIGEHSKLEDPAMERLIARISDANFPLRPTHTPTDEYRGSDSMQITAVIDGHKITFLRTEYNDGAGREYMTFEGTVDGKKLPESDRRALWLRWSEAIMIKDKRMATKRNLDSEDVYQEGEKMRSQEHAKAEDALKGALVNEINKLMS